MSSTYKLKNLSDRLLTSEEEVRLGRIVREGTAGSTEYENAFNTLVECNIRLVVKEANDFVKKSGAILDDLINEGFIGLVTAVEKFDPDKCPDARFATYALFWIRQRMYNYSYGDKLINVPRQVAVNISKYKRLIRNNDELERDDIMKELNVSNVELRNIENSNFKTSSLSDEYSGNDSFGDKKTTLSDMLADESETPLESVISTDKCKVIRELLDSYNPVERDIITMHYFTSEPLTLQDIAIKHKKSRERIRQIECRILYDMKKRLQNMEFQYSA